jgi:hypothetical protein
LVAVLTSHLRGGVDELALNFGGVTLKAGFGVLVRQFKVGVVSRLDVGALGILSGLEFVNSREPDCRCEEEY